MSCHQSCATCSTSAFNACLTCSTGFTLAGSSCFCDGWSSGCADTTIFKSSLIMTNSAYNAMFALIMLFFCLRVHLPLAYRIFSALQGISLLVFSQHIYLHYEDFYLLKTLAKSNGYYSQPYRTSTQPIHFITPPMVLFAGFTIGLLTLYFPTKIHTRDYDSYSSYFKENIWTYLSNFYYFAVRGMAYYVGLWIETVDTSALGLSFFILFALILALVSIKGIYDFHKGNIEEGVYEPELQLYCMLAPLTFIGLPMVSSTTLAVVIYCAPLSLLILIIILNRHYEVISKHKVGFYLVELIGVGVATGFLLAPDPGRHYILALMFFLAFIIMIIEGAARYHSGFQLEASAKVHPQIRSQTQGEGESNEPRQTMLKSKTRKAGKGPQYF